MNDRTIKILNKLFPYAEVEEQQSFGILKIYKTRKLLFM